MSYTLTKFGTLTLPTGNTNYTSSPAPAQLAFVETTAGAFDMDGNQFQTPVLLSRSKPVLPTPISFKCVVAEDLALTNRTTLDALRAAVGTAATITRLPDDASNTQQCYARLIAMPFDRSFSNRNSVFEISLEFQQLSQWLSNDHTPFATTLPTRTTNIVLPNNGNYPTHDVEIDIFVSAPYLTQFAIYNTTTSCAIRWDGTWSGTGMIVETGGRSIYTLPAAASAYAGFSLFAPFHRNQYWFELAPGNNAITIDVDSIAGSPQFSFLYFDTWA